MKQSSAVAHQVTTQPDTRVGAADATATDVLVDVIDLREETDRPHADESASRFTVDWAPPDH